MFVVNEKLALLEPFSMYYWQMPTNASKWPSRWWRWMETRWPGSSGSSSKRRWGLNAQTLVWASPIFISQTTRGCEGRVMWKIIYLRCGGGTSVMFHSLTGWLPPTEQMVHWLRDKTWISMGIKILECCLTAPEFSYNHTYSINALFAMNYTRIINI